MKKLIFICLLLLLFEYSCNTEKAPDCFQTAGKTVKKEVELEPFEEIMVYERVKLYVKEGPEFSAVVETGENLLNEVTAEGGEQQAEHQEYQCL